MGFLLGIEFKKDMEKFNALLIILIWIFLRLIGVHKCLENLKKHQNFLCTIFFVRNKISARAITITKQISFLLDFIWFNSLNKFRYNGALGEHLLYKFIKHHSQHQLKS